MNAQIEKLKAWYAALEQREQRMVAAGAVILAVLLIVGGLLMPIESAVSAATKRAATRRADLEWMRINASEIEAAGTLPTVNSRDPPVVIVDRVGRESGLGDALRGTQPSANGVRVQLEAAPFDAMITWVAALDSRYGLALDSITVDRGARPGLVNANITFTAPKP